MENSTTGGATRTIDPKVYGDGSQGGTDTQTVIVTLNGVTRTGRDRADTRDRILEALEEAERQAWNSLARYKFQMFGYWAAIWVHLNRLGKFGRPSPFRGLVVAARENQSGALTADSRSAIV